MLSIKYILTISFFLLIPFNSFAQTLSNIIALSDSFIINYEDSYKLSEPAVIDSTIEVEINNKIIADKFFRFLPVSNSIQLSAKLNYHIFDTLVVNYKAFKLPIKKEYYKHKLIRLFSDKLNDSLLVMKSPEKSFSPDAIFGKGLKRSGTIIRGITVGTNSGTKLKSGLRLELSGKLSKNIELVAALTDQNSPIQPEGVTERLNEIDKVFIQLRHPYGKETFGDYYLNKNFGMFSKINRKLQGLEAEFTTNNYKASVAFASQRGKFTSNRFNGIDGVQGPYRLHGENNERNIIVIAGTEEVYVDGKKMRRGENNDYTIDYSNSSILFKAKRMITSASRIYVEFQYTDRKFERTFENASASAKLFNNSLVVTASYISENDDENNPIDFSFSEQEKQILKLAGNSTEKAVVSGVRLANADSTGRRNGIYTKIDTVINSSPYYYYKYSPGSETAIYFVTFSYIGEGKGDYEMISLAEYRFVGVGKGAYLPVKLLPLPEKKELGDINFTYQPTNWLNIKGEFAGSIYDRNKFSSIDDSDNFGFARNIEIELNHKNTPILGEFNISFAERFIDSKFSPLERIDGVEFNRNYNINETSNLSQLKRELNISSKPFNGLSFFGNYGSVKYSDELFSNRYNFGFNYSAGEQYGVKFNNNFVSSRNNGVSNTFLDQQGSGFLKIWKVEAGFSFERDKKDDFLRSADSLINRSHDYLEVSPFLKSKRVSGLQLTYKLRLRKEKEPLFNKLSNKSDSYAHQLELSYTGWRSFNTNFSFALRRKEFYPDWIKKGLLNNESVLIRSLSKIKLFSGFVQGSFFYNAATEKAAKLQRIFLPVPVGTGNYIYLGDLNSNGIADENEFEPTTINGNFIVSSIPTDQLFPVVNLQLSSRWKIDFAKLFKYKSVWKTFLAPISSETFFRTDEKSKITDTKKIYLLNRSYFLNDSTTITGSDIFQQDFYLYRFNSSFSLRGRFLQKKYLRQYSNGIISGFKKEKSLRLRAKLAREIRYQADYFIKDDNLLSGTNFSRSHLANSEEFDSDFSYRPYNNFEIGIKFGVGKTTDRLPEVPTEINYNSQMVRLDYSIVGKGRIRFSVERKELLSNVEDYKIPWEITEGKRIGKNYLLRLNIDYKLSPNLQSSLVYTGLKYGKENFIHTMRAEARAYF